MKIGDGTTPWNNLPYSGGAVSESEIESMIKSYVDKTIGGIENGTY